MFNEFNLKRGQRAERKLLITVAEWSEDGETMREILGTRTEDSSIEYNAEINTITDIRGINYTDIDTTQPQQDFDPYLVLGGSKLGAKLNDIRRRNTISELNQFTMYIITAFVGNVKGGYEAERHANCTIVYNSFGGDANVNFPISVYFSNDITNGTVDKLSDDFTFNPSGEVIPESRDVMVPSGNVMFKGMRARDLIDDDVMVASNGSVTGTLKYVEGYKEFSSNPEEQKGNFFPFLLDVTGTTLTLQKNGKEAKTVPFDPSIVAIIPDKNTTLSITVDDKHIITLDFDGATLTPAMGG